MRKGFTLIELMITLTMFAILAAVTVYLSRAILLGFSSGEARAGIGISLDWGMEQMARNLREANNIQSSNDEIRYTVNEGGSDNDYIFYLYNADDSYPLNFDQESYEIRRASLSGGIGGTFTYGSGHIMISEVLPPPTSELSYSGNIVTIDLSVTRKGETIRSRTEVNPRNL